MQKTWNVTLYHDGKPISEQRGVSQRDVVTQIHLLSGTTSPVELVQQMGLPTTGGLPDTRELALAAA